jgi:signal transduction histidine kinase
VVTIQNCSLFSQLTQDELGRLRHIARERSYPAGGEIYKRGDLIDGAFFLKDGLVELSISVGPLANHVFSGAVPGDLFGEGGGMPGKHFRIVSAIAREPTLVDFLPREELLELMESSTALSFVILQAVGDHVVDFNRRYVDDVLYTERLALIGRFAGTIIHDLKNPLNTIGLLAEVAALENATPQMRREAGTDLRRQVQRISNLVGEILDFAKGSQTNGFPVTSINYANFIHRLVEDLRPEAALKSVTLELENAPPASNLRLNPQRLSRVFDNLVLNATDAMPSGGKIVIRFLKSPTEVVTEIEDTGPGIAPEIIPQLFQPFASYGKAEGTGLGLTICKRIIEDHHGWISATSSAGHGARFAFGLPIPEDS